MLERFNGWIQNVMARLVSERGEFSLEDKPEVKVNPDDSYETSLDEEFAKKFTEGTEEVTDTDESDEDEPETEDSGESGQESQGEAVEEKPLSDEEVLGYLRGKGFDGDDLSGLIEDAKGKKTYQRKHQEISGLNAVLNKDPRFEALVKEIVMERLTGAQPEPSKPPPGMEKYTPEQIETMRQQARFLVGAEEQSQKPSFDPNAFKQEIMSEVEERNAFNLFVTKHKEEITPRINQIMQMVAKTHGITNVSYQTLEFLLDTAQRLEREAIENKSSKVNKEDKPIGNPPSGGRDNQKASPGTLENAKTDSDFEKIWLTKIAKKRGWVT